jgi:DNA-binding NarL/FixJ family response regulator
VAGAIRVLVVDDHAVVRSGLSSFLGSEEDLELVGQASDGLEALDILTQLDNESRRPDVVVMDLQMTPIDGIETTRRIRAAYPDVEVVALTSFGEHYRVDAALAAGASGYLLKDADADEIATAIRAVHRGELPIDPALARDILSERRTSPPSAPERNLTSRELDVLRLLADGQSNKEIARELGISGGTVRAHVSSILAKLDAHSRTQAALQAVREGLVAEHDDRSSGP